MINEVIYYDIPEIVKVRKHIIDISEFQNFIKQHKKMSNKQLAKLLNVPVTEVEHWFRKDKFFAIPSDKIWTQLKNALGINSNIYDAFVMEFEERQGIHEQSNRVYDINGISPTITSTNADIRIII